MKCEKSKKIIYLTKKEADKEIDYMFKVTCLILFYYKCPHCNYYHLTKSPQ